LLELALVTPILVILVMAIFQFAYVMQSQVGLTNAVREAARRVATSTATVPSWTGSGSLTEWTEKQLCGDLAAPCGPGGLLAANVQGFDGTKLVGDLPTVTFTCYLVDSVPNYQVEITAHYEHPVFFGPITFATDLVDGTPGNGYWDLTATAQMRMEADFDPTDLSWTDPSVCS
jgi:hypothetical protein